MKKGEGMRTRFVSMMIIVAILFLFISFPVARADDNVQAIVKSNNSFSLDLYRQFKVNGGNLFFSPYSISAVLTMTYEGAMGQTAKEIQAVLHLPNDREKIRYDYLNMHAKFNKEGKSRDLTCANALWAQKSYPFADEYLKIISEYYDGKAMNLDFAGDAENSFVTINNWVENKTNNKIKNLIPSWAITPMTRLVITNAIYFKADWLEQFDAGKTRNEQFKLDSGQTVDAQMMHKTYDCKYGETSDIQILEMDYLGDDISMLIILPKNNDISSVENTISEQKIYDWKKGMEKKKVIISLPKFKFETKYFMRDDLMAMGMPSAFGPVADFSGMTSRPGLYISDVIHQAFIEVAEYGTEAAAATAVMESEWCSKEGNKMEPKIFKADHPFIFIIQQKYTGNILFMGRIYDPTK